MTVSPDKKVDIFMWAGGGIMLVMVFAFVAFSGTMADDKVKEHMDDVEHARTPVEQSDVQAVENKVALLANDVKHIKDAVDTAGKQAKDNAGTLGKHGATLDLIWDKVKDL